MNVTSLRYQPVEGGALGGHFALHVTLGPSNGAGSISPTDLSTKVHDAFDKLAVRSNIKGVLVDCRNLGASNSDMDALLGTLRDWGLFINLWVGEKTRFPWFTYANYITVFLTKPKWPNFRVSEVRYFPPPLGDWEEPEIFEVNKDATCWFTPSARATPAEVVKFASETRRPWGVTSWGFEKRTIPSVTFKLDE